MKKFLLLMLGLTMAVGASAIDKGDLTPRPDLPSVQSPLPNHNNFKSFIKTRMGDRLVSRDAQVGEDGVIFDQPEGELVIMIRTGFTLEVYGEVYPQYGKAYFVYDPDGETVYIQDPLYTDPFETWVRGTIANGKIHVPLGQPIYPGDEGPLSLTWGSFTMGEGYYQFTPDPSVTEITYTIGADGSISMDGSYYSGNYGDVAVGSAGMWPNADEVSAIAYGTTYIPYFEPTVIYDQPEGELVTYKRGGNGYWQTIKKGEKKEANRYIPTGGINKQEGVFNVVFAPDGQTVYLQDIVYLGEDHNRNTWVQGTLSADGTKITVPLDQYASWDEYEACGELLAWGSISVEAPMPGNEDYEQHVIFTPDPTVTQVTFTVLENGIIMDNSVGCTAKEFWDLFYQYQDDEIEWEDYQQALEALYQNTGLAYMEMNGRWSEVLNWGTKAFTKQPATLPDPVILEWNEAYSKWSDSYLVVEVPDVDTEGRPIFEDALSYSIYTDNDQIFTFEASKYYIDEDMTEITYDTWENQDWNLYIGYPTFLGTWSETDNCYVPFFRWRIGIQFHYTVDGVKNSTNITYIEVYDKPGDLDGTPGDVDGSGNVDIDDVTQMISRVLGNSSQPGFIDANADLNGDHVSDIDDVTIAINIVLGN